MSELMEMAERAVALAREAGADEVSAHVSRGRSLSVEYRDGVLEQVRESASAGLSVTLYVDGRYSAHGTSDLRPEAVGPFIGRAVEMTRLLQPDPHRGLADPALYAGRPEVDLESADPGWDAMAVDRRKALAEAAMAAARGAEGPIISVTSGFSDSHSQSARVHSNGFAGEREGTRFGVGVEVSARDAGDRKPEGASYASARFLADLPDPAEVGSEAARRALSRLGQTKLKSGEMTLVVENRVAGRLLGTFLSGLSGGALQQRQTFLLDRLGASVGSPLFTLVDDPLVPRGLGSRLYDADGLPARQRALVEGGVLREYLIDVYYGRKLGVTPTGGSTANLFLPPGEKSLDGLLAEVGQGIFVTGLLGGNADLPTGDFSHGLVGFEIVDGRLGRPVGEMNLTGSHVDLWNHLVAVGDDPYPYSAYRVPSLVFEGQSVSGS